MDIFEASRTGNLERVKELIASGADINAINHRGINVLYTAIIYGNFDIVRVLIEHGVDINARTPKGRTALITAAEHDALEIVRELIAHGANVNVQQIDGNSSLILASSNGSLEIVKELIGHGVIINLRNIDGINALMMASKNDHLDVVRELIANGADVNATDNYNNTALISASTYGHLEVVRELIAHSADVNATDNYNNTALIRASTEGNLEVVRELISHGANVNAMGDRGYNALIMASVGNNLEIVKELITNGANVNSTNMNGDTALGIASEHNFTTIVNELLANGADVNLIRRRAPPIQTNPNFDLIREQKQQIIQKTNEAIAADTSTPNDINLDDLGCDVILSGCDKQDNKIQDFINENPDNTIVIKMIDSATSSRHFLFTKDNLLLALQGSVVYPCLEANNLPGRESNVITDLPLYNLAPLIDVKILIKKEALDSLLQNTGNLFVVVNKHVFSYPTIASHNVVFESGEWVGGLHCNSGAEAEKLYNIKRVNLPVFLGGTYYNKFMKYKLKLKI